MSQCNYDVLFPSADRFVRDGPAFLRALAMGSLQFCSFVKTGPLPALSPNLAAPSPPVVQAESGRRMQTCTTLSAGKSPKRFVESGDETSESAI